jgi:hypothetical protein
MKSATKVILLLLIGMVMAPCQSQAQNSREAEFRTFYAEFLSAVRANDKNKIADLVAFPVEDWSIERKGNVETIGVKDKAEFLAKFDLLFTSSMRSHALKAKPQKVSDNHYMLSWDDANAEFSFEFEYRSAKAFRVTAFGIGPR